jgi:hypothetical protein
VPLYPPQTTTCTTRMRTRAAAVGNERLTAWAMARPHNASSYSQRFTWNFVKSQHVLFLRWTGTLLILMYSATGLHGVTVHSHHLETLRSRMKPFGFSPVENSSVHPFRHVLYKLSCFLWFLPYSCPSYKLPSDT